MGSFTLSIREERCKGCELCVSVCPKGVLAINKDKPNAAGYFPASVVKQDECVGCQSCVRMCPDVAITIEKKD
ncbi:MAG: 4Fe-4S dicluster domain-containing protein [Lachnospiraceae bacterium]|nr:4Fe-4S dicluster domain-containing protein [Lachnospiraceae bacterium]